MYIWAELTILWTFGWCCFSPSLLCLWTNLVSRWNIWWKAASFISVKTSVTWYKHPYRFHIWLDEEFCFHTVFLRLLLQVFSPVLFTTCKRTVTQLYRITVTVRLTSKIHEFNSEPKPVEQCKNETATWGMLLPAGHNNLEHTITV